MKGRCPSRGHGAVGGSVKSVIVIRHLKLGGLKHCGVVKDLQSVAESCISEENCDLKKNSSPLLTFEEERCSSRLRQKDL